MSVIPDAVVDRIREHADVVEVISRYVTLKKSGRNYKGLCPFHQEKEPSFVVSPEKQLFHCFGCGTGGNVFTFVMKYENVSFSEAARMLAQRYGIRIPTVSGTTQDRQRQKLFRINALAKEWFIQQLHESREGQRYLKEREIGKELQEDYELGYVPKQWHGLTDFLRGKGVALKDAEALGLVAAKESRWYDRFRHRIMFPIFDTQNRVIGFGGRAIVDETAPKYLNSPETVLYHKGKNLYGLNVARKYIGRESGKVYVVEGYFDLLSMAQRGVRNVVAALGTAFTSEQIRLLRRFVSDVSLLFDADEAGKNAALKAIRAFLREDVVPEVVLLPEGLDPDEYCRRGLPVDTLLQDAVPGVEFGMGVLINSFDLTNEDGRRRGTQAVLPFLVEIRDGVTRDLYLRRLAEKVKVRETTILDAARGMQRARGGSQKEENLPRIRVSAERTLLEVMISSPRMIPVVEEAGVIDDFEDGTLRRIAETVLDEAQQRGDVSIDRIVLRLDEAEMSDVVAHLAFSNQELQYQEEERIVLDCIRVIKITALQRKRDELKRRVKDAETRGDDALLQSLLLGIEGLGHQIQQLKDERIKQSSLRR
jgi:DNA primase